jgi:hypothetical protein
MVYSLKPLFKIDLLCMLAIVVLEKELVVASGSAEEMMSRNSIFNKLIYLRSNITITNHDHKPSSPNKSASESLAPFCCGAVLAVGVALVGWLAFPGPMHEKKQPTNSKINRIKNGKRTKN